MSEVNCLVDPTKEQMNMLGWQTGAIASAYFLFLIYTCYCMWKYMIETKLYQPAVVLFYVSSVATVIARILEFSAYTASNFSLAQIHHLAYISIDLA